MFVIEIQKLGRFTTCKIFYIRPNGLTFQFPRKFCFKEQQLVTMILDSLQ